MVRRKIKMPLIRRKEISEKTYEIRFGLKNKIVYSAGQYVVVILDKKITDGTGNRRSFSLSSSPENKKYISTCFRFSEEHSEFKGYIMNAPLGTGVDVQGPLGKFILPKEAIEENIVLIAGGVGITPFISMLRDVAHRKSSQAITLIYTDKSPERMSYYDELVKLDFANPNFNFVNRFKRIDEDYIRKNCYLKKSLFYICGAPGMVKGVSELLKKMKVKEENIKIENFTGY